MKARNLRIGNKVDLYGSTATIQGQDFVNHYNAGDKNFDRFKPIELTDEWLNAFGFNNKMLDAEHNNIVWFDNHIGIKGMLGIVKPVECKYVHQLQNLFFAFTGTELELKVIM
jgi:hypothetical protein